MDLVSFLHILCRFLRCIRFVQCGQHETNGFISFFLCWVGFLTSIWRSLNDLNDCSSMTFVENLWTSKVSTFFKFNSSHWFLRNAPTWCHLHQPLAPRYGWLTDEDRLEKSGVLRDLRVSELKGSTWVDISAYHLFVAGKITNDLNGVDVSLSEPNKNNTGIYISLFSRGWFTYHMIQMSKATWEKHIQYFRLMGRDSLF